MKFFKVGPENEHIGMGAPYAATDVVHDSLISFMVKN